RDQTFRVQANERLPHGARQALVEREPLARPVAGSAHHLQLTPDVAVVLLLPRPHPLEEPLASQLDAAGAFTRELALDHQLSRDPRVVGAREPERVVALHAPPARQHVLKRRLQRVTHVEPAGDVGRRDRDAERLPAGARFGPEPPTPGPFLLPARFETAGIEAGFHRGSPSVNVPSPGRRAADRLAA